MQNPNAKTVHGLKSWNKLGRHITPGEKAITIFKPIIVKGEEEIKKCFNNIVLNILT